MHLDVVQLARLQFALTLMFESLRTHFFSTCMVTGLHLLVDLDHHC